jgi:hypothetical protein
MQMAEAEAVEVGCQMSGCEEGETMKDGCDGQEKDMVR